MLSAHGLMLSSTKGLRVHMPVEFLTTDTGILYRYHALEVGGKFDHAAERRGVAYICMYLYTGSSIQYPWVCVLDE
jgi:hypothetical protein